MTCINNYYNWGIFSFQDDISPGTLCKTNIYSGKTSNQLDTYPLFHLWLGLGIVIWCTAGDRWSDICGYSRHRGTRKGVVKPVAWWSHMPVWSTQLTRVDPWTKMVHNNAMQCHEVPEQDQNWTSTVVHLILSHFWCSMAFSSWIIKEHFISCSWYHSATHSIHAVGIIEHENTCCSVKFT